MALPSSSVTPTSTPTSFLLFFSPSPPNKKKHPTFICHSSTKTPPEPPPTSEPTSPSLSDQLRPLSLTLLQNQNQTHTRTQNPKPKPTWVNPSKPKPYILSLTRHKRRSPQPNNASNEDDLTVTVVSRQLSSCTSRDQLTAALDAEFPDKPPSAESALLILSSLRPWQNAHHFLQWLRRKNTPSPLDTILYNVLMKSLRHAAQFDLVDTLARQMLDDGTPLDNITYSTLITCLKKSRRFDDAIEWFERMYKTGVIPDEVTYSAVLDVYARVGKREEVMGLYERARAAGWTPDPVAFSVLARMFGEAGDYDGIRYVLREMEELGVKPNVVVYNTLLEGMGRAGKPGLARSLFEEMVSAGLSPDEKTLTALIKIYGKARWGKDAMELWERMRANNWPVDFILYNTLLSMCADLGLEEEAEKLFEEMKKNRVVIVVGGGGGRSRTRPPDSWSYTAMINIYGSAGKPDRALEMFEEMVEKGVEPNVMGCTCLIQCLAKAGRVGDAVRVFDTSLARGIKPDDRLCGCLLSVVALCEEGEMDSVLACLEKANPRLVGLIKILGEEETSFDKVKEEFRGILNGASVDVRRPFCNCLIDICRNRCFPSQRAHELLYLGTLFGLYPGLHKKTSEEWSLNLRSLSVGAAKTAFEEWIDSLCGSARNDEIWPQSFSVHTGSGTHKFSQGLPVAFFLHLKTLDVPFQRDELRSGSFVAAKDDVISWVQSRVRSAAATA